MNENKINQCPNPNNQDELLDFLLSVDFSKIDLDKEAPDPTVNNNSSNNKDNKEVKGRAWKVPIQLRRLFAYMQLADQRSVSTAPLTYAFGFGLFF